ncbi:hypothetical protein N7530_012872 [Penicillium desertorum]|uniref:Uncharacterized protein n=1 Tax=Penicillium desertorum TaxID=1303715 RepID=A0A9X0BFG5_9EURO|nr:hypothetical protein N7530_012872 [Penicillium desertorum]
MGSVSLCRDEDNSSPHLPCQADPLSGSDGCCLVPLLSPGGVHPPHPGAFWRPAPLESVDRWPLAIPETQIPGGSRPVGSAVRRRCPRGLDPSCEGHMPQPASAFTGAWSDPLRADWCWRSLVGAIGWFQRPPPVRRGCRRNRAPRAPLPFNYILPPRGRAPGLKPRVALP